MILAVVGLVGGLILLTLGADRFVVSATRLSQSLGLSPILIGALVIGLGTSAPEMLVSGLAAGRGEIDLALGNVVGSNTANVTLVLGTAAMVTPVVSRLRTIRREGLTMMVALVVFMLLLFNLELKRWEAAGLAISMVVVVLALMWWSRSDAKAGRAPVVKTEPWSGRTADEALIGLGALSITLVGAELLIRGATSLADDLGISSAFVGLVIVSVGTSLPELATALAAARRGETDLILGNVLGSNLFNTLAVAGLAGLVGPGRVDAAFRDALWFMVAAGGAAGLFAASGKVERWEGASLLAIFVGFVAVAA